VKKYIFITLLSLIIALSGCTSAEDKAQDYYQSAKSLYDKKEYKKSLIELKNALKINPKLADAFYLKGKIYERQQQWKAMYANMLQANELDPDNALIIVALGAVDLLSGNIEEARKKVDLALSLEADNVDALTLSAAINYKQSLTDEASQTELQEKAFADFNKASTIAPGFYATPRI